MKRCTGCRSEKEESEFTKRAATKDGLCPYCKICSRESGLKSANKYKKERIQYSKEWYEHRKKDKVFMEKRTSACTRKVYERKGTVVGRARYLLYQAKGRSKKLGIDFSLDEQWLVSKFKEQENRCSLTGLEFDFNHGKGLYRTKNPYAPSLDRIDCLKGYTEDNVRLICSCVNIALNDWGKEILLTWIPKFLELQK